MQRTIAIRVLLLLGAGLVVGGADLAQRPGSIYDPRQGPISPIADKTARRPGDLLTVLIAETQGIKNEETSQLQRQTTLDYALTSFDIAPTAFNPLPTVGATSQDDFNGRANYEKKGQFTARITVLVVDVLPNGNLVIQGRREIRIDRETKLIEFSGLVRREDVKPDNTVTSELVADARISYSGEGALTETTNRVGLGNAARSHRIQSAGSERP